MPTNRYGDSGLFDPIHGDGYEDEPDDVEDVGPPVPGEGDELENPEVGMKC